MRTLFLMAAAAALVAADAPAGRSVADLAWLGGRWVEEAGDGRWTEERWAPPRGGVMLGTNLSGRADKAGAYEFIRIVADGEGRVSYWASPGGKPAVPFRLVSATASSAVFENPAHDFPTRIVYRRDGKLLTATISGPGGASVRSWSFRRR